MAGKKVNAYYGAFFAIVCITTSYFFYERFKLISLDHSKLIRSAYVIIFGEPLTDFHLINGLTVLYFFAAIISLGMMVYFFNGINGKEGIDRKQSVQKRWGKPKSKENLNFLQTSSDSDVQAKSVGSPVRTSNIHNISHTSKVKSSDEKKQKEGSGEIEIRHKGEDNNQLRKKILVEKRSIGDRFRDLYYSLLISITDGSGTVKENQAKALKREAGYSEEEIENPDIKPPIVISRKKYEWVEGVISDKSIEESEYKLKYGTIINPEVDEPVQSKDSHTKEENDSSSTLPESLTNEFSEEKDAEYNSALFDSDPVYGPRSDEETEFDSDEYNDFFKSSEEEPDGSNVEENNEDFKEYVEKRIDGLYCQLSDMLAEKYQKLDEVFDQIRDIREKLNITSIESEKAAQSDIEEDEEYKELKSLEKIALSIVDEVRNEERREARMQFNRSSA